MCATVAPHRGNHAIDNVAHICVRLFEPEGSRLKTTEVQQSVRQAGDSFGLRLDRLQRLEHLLIRASTLLQPPLRKLCEPAHGRSWLTQLMTGYRDEQVALPARLLCGSARS